MTLKDKMSNSVVSSKCKKGENVRQESVVDFVFF